MFSYWPTRICNVELHTAGACAVRFHNGFLLCFEGVGVNEVLFVFTLSYTHLVKCSGIRKFFFG